MPQDAVLSLLQAQKADEGALVPLGPFILNEVLDTVNTDSSGVREKC